MNATSFISLSRLSGQCVHQPLLVSGVYYLDSNGSWNGGPYYNPNAAVYSLEVRNFKKTTEEYSNEVKLSKLSFDQISMIETRNNLAYNLLYWIGWSEITFHKNSDKSISTSRWQLTGDAKEILDNVGKAGSLSNVKSECMAKAAVDYNSLTGRFVMTYGTEKFVNDQSCNNITVLTKIDPLISRGNVDSITVAWDGVSLLIAAAVNEGVSTQSVLSDGVAGKILLIPYGSLWTHIALMCLQRAVGGTGIFPLPHRTTNIDNLFSTCSFIEILFHI